MPDRHLVDGRWIIPDEYNYAFDVFDKQAERYPHKTALLTISSDGFTAVKHSFDELRMLSMKLSLSLCSMGLAKGEKAILLMGQVPEWYISSLALMRAGLISIPTTTLNTKNDLAYRCQISEASIIFAAYDQVPKVAETVAECPQIRHIVVIGSGLLPRSSSHVSWHSISTLIAEARASVVTPYDLHGKTKSNDPLLIFFTSGTTGKPKMVLHLHKYPIGHEVTVKYYDLRVNDVHWTLSDPGWAKTYYGKFIGQWMIPCTIVQHDHQGKFEPKLVLDIITKYKITSFCAPPTGFRMLIHEDIDKSAFGALQNCTSAGEPLNPEVITTWFEKTGCLIREYYAQSETTILVGNGPREKLKEGSMGKPAPGQKIRIVDDEGNEVPRNTPGHIAISVDPRPPGLFVEYWKDPENTANVFHHGWYFTLDKAYEDDDGYFWYVGRADDVIKSGAYRIGPFEIESALLEHPSVKESAVIGIPDEERGQIVKAFVILLPGFVASKQLATELQEHVKKTTAPYKYPRLIEFVDELPKTISGKIQRAQLRLREAQKAKARSKL